MDYCYYFFEDDVDACLELDHYFVQCGFGQLSSTAHDVLEDGVKNGRDGKGMVLVFAAGNEFRKGDDVNYEGYLNSRFTISVGSVGQDLKHARYSSSGAPVFISAPGGDWENYHLIFAAKPLSMNAPDDCGDSGAGTSYAAPLVSGVVALMLEANSDLTWRDVQGVLAATASRPHEDSEDEWETNQAGIKHSYKYGFGVVDAYEAVMTAKSWSNWGSEITLVTATTANDVIEDCCGNWVESESIEFGSHDFVIESVSVYVTIEHPRRGDLRIEFERDGVSSLLTDDKLERGTRYTHHKYTTLRHWGERADQGAFTLRVADMREGSGDDDDLGQDTSFYYYDDDGDDDGILVSWTLQLYGHDADLSTPWTPQPTPQAVGCDRVEVAGFEYQPADGIYGRAGECEGVAMYEDNGIYLWWMDSYWYVGNDPCQDDYAAAYVYDDDADLVSLIGTWTEYQGSSKGWRANADVYASMPRRHAGPDAGHAGADAGAVAGTYLFSDDAPAVARAVDAGALAPTDERADLFSDDTGALRVAVAGAYASANTNTDAGALREAYAPADARAVRKSDALTHGLAPAHAAADAQTYSETHPNADAAPYAYADHAATVARGRR